MKDLIKKPIVLSVLGGILLWAGWPTSPLFPLLFIGMAVLLFSAHQMIEKEYSGFKFFGVLYIGLFTWNALTTWWIVNATVGGVSIAVICNSLLMTIPFLFYRLSRKVEANKLAPFVFLVCWLGYEYLHHNWSLNWPWLTLGNGLASYPQLIQWLEFTGVHGASLWILLINLMIFGILKRGEISIKNFIPVSILFFIPVGVSLLLLTQSFDSKKESEVVVVQPNFNTYTQKSGPDRISSPNQVAMMINQSKTKLTQNTEFLVWPETAINGHGGFRESNFKNSTEYSLIQHLLKEYPDLTIISGLNAYEICKDQLNPPEFAPYARGVGYYESYNATVMITEDSLSFYHKSKFVPGAEQIPFPWLIKPVSLLLGDVSFGHSFGQENIVPFEGKNGTQVSPAVCYESIFGEFMTQFVQNKSDIHFIITNDDWWHDTEGHRQHFLYAKLRAIESRKAIARSANTGTSGFIDAYGNDDQTTEYRTSAVIRKKLKLQEGSTFYVAHGDYIARTASYLAVILIISLFVKRFTPKRP